MLERAIEMMSQVDGHEQYSDDFVKSAAVYAAIAQAEALGRIATALEKLVGCVDGSGRLNIRIPEAVMIEDI